MKIKIFPLVSSLHDKKLVNETTNEFINLIKERLNCEIEIETDVSCFYDADLSLIFVQTGGSESIFLENFKDLKAPFYILTHGYSNSLAASIEILSYLNLNNIKGEILHGSVNYICERILKLVEDK